MKNLKSFIGILSIVLIGCGDNTSVDHAHHQSQATIQSNESADVLSLNNGEKWKCNEEMMVYIRESEQMVSSFEPAIDSYLDLANGLKEGIGKITSNCTMKGESHEELHKWLLPYIDLVNELSETESPDGAVEKIDQLSEKFVEFNTYFE